MAAVPTSCHCSSASSERWRAAHSVRPGRPTRAHRLGLLTRIVPALKVDGKFVPNPFAITDRWIDGQGRLVFGEPVEAEQRTAAKQLLGRGEVDLSLLDTEVDALITSLAMTVPDV